MAWYMLVVRPPPTADKAQHMADIIAGRVSTEWLAEFDADGYAGRGLIRTTPDRSQAMRFPTFEAVIECWKTQSTAVPLRDDGLPNRPLTAHTVRPIEADDT